VYKASPQGEGALLTPVEVDRGTPSISKGQECHEAFAKKKWTSHRGKKLREPDKQA